jgi:hypothetical protein
MSEKSVFPRAQKRWPIDMTTRSRRETVHFKHPFLIRGVVRLLPPGAYQVITGEGMIEGLSFPSFFHRHDDHGPGAAPRHSSMIPINSVDLSVHHS